MKPLTPRQKWAIKELQKSHDLYSNYRTDVNVIGNKVIETELFYWLVSNYIIEDAHHAEPKTHIFRWGISDYGKGIKV